LRGKSRLGRIETIFAEKWKKIKKLILFNELKKIKMKEKFSYMDFQMLLKYLVLV